MDDGDGPRRAKREDTLSHRRAPGIREPRPLRADGGHAQPDNGRARGFECRARRHQGRVRKDGRADRPRHALRARGGVHRRHPQALGGAKADQLRGEIRETRRRALLARPGGRDAPVLSRRRIARRTQARGDAVGRLSRLDRAGGGDPKASGARAGLFRRGGADARLRRALPSGDARHRGRGLGGDARTFEPGGGFREGAARRAGGRHEHGGRRRPGARVRGFPGRSSSLERHLAGSGELRLRARGNARANRGGASRLLAAGHR